LSFLPLTFGVGLPSGVGGRGLGPLPKAKAEKILKQDDFTCRFCGFRSIQYQRTVPFKDDFVTACGFCEQVLFLERAGMMGTGVLIWLPEISQAELNHIARAIYVARAEDGSDMALTAERALDALMARKTEAKKRLGSEDPLLLSAVLTEHLSDKERAVATGKLDGIRLLPLDKHMVRSRSGDINGFPQIVKFWRSDRGPFAKLPADSWKDLFAKVV
jgi:intracellular multiplication protein IcmJ